MTKRKIYWFWAWITQITLPKQKKRFRQTILTGEVWRNLILVSGHTENEAIRKAKRVGIESQGDARGSLTLNGKPALTKFIGIEGMGLVHDLVFDELNNGMEIYFTEKRSSLPVARKRLINERILASKLKAELQPYLRLKRQKRTGHRSG